MGGNVAQARGPGVSPWAMVLARRVVGAGATAFGRKLKDHRTLADGFWRDIARDAFIERGE